VPCRSVRILVVGILSRDTLFNFSDFDWEVCYGPALPTVQVLVLLLAIGKVGWKLFILSVFYLKIGENSKGVKERGMISKWELVRICYLCVMGRSFLF